MLTKFSLAHPRIIAGGWLLLTVVLAVFALQLPKDVKAGGFNNEHGPALAGQRINEDVFGDAANELAVVVRSESPVTSATLTKIHDAARKIPGVSRVTDAAQRPQLASRDKKTQVVLVGFGTDNTATQNQVQPLRKSLADATRGQAVSTHVTGGPALDYDLNIQSTKDAKNAEFIAFPLLIVVVLLVYRAVGPTLLTLTVAGVALMMTQGIGDLLTRQFSISNMYVTGSSLIGLAVSVDYCLFVLKRHQEFVQSGMSPRDAIQAATHTAGHAVRFGGVAVIAALSALFIPRNMVFSSIALSGIIVTLLAIALTTTFLPAVVSILGPRLFFGKLPGFAHAVDEPKHNSWVAAAVKKPGIVAAALTAVFLALATPLASLELRVPVASASILPAGADSRQGIETMNGRLDSRALFPTTVTLEASSLDDVLSATRNFTKSSDELSGAESVLSATSLSGTSQVRARVESTGSFSAQQFPLVTRDGSTYYSRIVVTAKDNPDSGAAHELVRQVRDRADALPVTAHVTGATAQGLDFDDLVEESIPWIVGVVALASLILLGFAFRSVWLPAVAMALNGLVVTAAMGTLTFLWRAITGESINSVTPIVMFAIIFGLSMDYMVLMTNRMKEEHARLGEHHKSILEGSGRTARLVTSAAVIMLAVFLSFLVAEISIVRQLGIGLAIAVFFDAFIVRPLLMPAVLSLLGERVWGRPRHSAISGKDSTPTGSVLTAQGTPEAHPATTPPIARP